MRGYDLGQDHAHCEGGLEHHEIDYMMDRRECNDAGSKVNESNRDPFELRRMGVRMVVERGVGNITSR